MQHNGNPSTSSSNGSMDEEYGARTGSMEDEAIPWMVMVQPHVGMETTAEPSTEEVCRQKLDSCLDYVWRCAILKNGLPSEQMVAESRAFVASGC